MDNKTTTTSNTPLPWEQQQVQSTTYKYRDPEKRRTYMRRYMREYRRRQRESDPTRGPQPFVGEAENAQSF